MEQRDPFAIVPLWLIERASPPAVRLYAWIGAKYASGSAGAVWPSQKTLAADLSSSERSVRYWLDELAQLGAIQVQHRPGSSSVTTLVARTAPPLSARTPATDCRGTPATDFRGVRQPVAGQSGNGLPPNQKTQEPDAAPPPPARAQGGGVGAVNPTRTAAEIAADRDRAAAGAMDPDTYHAKVRALRDELNATRARHPSTPKDPP